MMDFSERSDVIDAALEAHYLSLPGKTDAGWQAVKKEPVKYNRIWRHALGLELRDDPPSEDARQVHPTTGEYFGDQQQKTAFRRPSAPRRG